MKHGYAKRFAQEALLKEAERLETLLPNTDTVRRNIENIKTSNPPNRMSFDDLCAYVDLLFRSVKS